MTVNRGILLFSLFLAFLLAACTRTKATDPFPNITLPAHPKAINPETQYDSPAKGAKAVVYKVNMPFPAEEITAFYDIEFKKIGYERFTEDGGATFEWENFNPKTGQWEKTATIPARYTAVWVDPKRSIRIWVYIAYKYDGMNEDWKVKPIVSINMAKFFDLRDNRPPESAKQK